MIDPRLEEFATATQRKYIKAVNEHGTNAKAERALGLSNDTVSKSLRALKRAAAAKGFAPEHDLTRPAAPGFAVKGTSTYYNEAGKVTGQWVKTTRNQAETEEILREFVQHLMQDVKGLAPLANVPKHVDTDLLCVYPMGDPHYGMKAWWQDAGDNFDLEIAERLTTGAIDRLVSTAPDAETALLLNLGDMFHADNQSNVTRSGHQLDVDGRWKKVQQVGLRSMIHCVRRLLEKHARVIFRIEGGNHDGHSSYALALALDAYFHLEPRVEVDLSAGPVWYHQFGANLIGSTHGDTVKGPDLPAIMAHDRPKEWGDTKHRVWLVGHVHHEDRKEYRGCTVEYFRTLAARDAWHQGQGYRAGRDMRLIVLHREHGEIERHRCDVAMLA